MRVGLGYDSHRFAAGRKLILGGVEIAHPLGLAGHSDADAVAHALTDAVLGAAGLGDIGTMFPDSEPRWQGADSLERSEEHTSELQSQSNLVCRLLLEKKKK